MIDYPCLRAIKDSIGEAVGFIRLAKEKNPFSCSMWHTVECRAPNLASPKLASPSFVQEGNQ